MHVPGSEVATLIHSGGLVLVLDCEIASLRCGLMMKWAPLNTKQYVTNVKGIFLLATYTFTPGLSQPNV